MEQVEGRALLSHVAPAAASAAPAVVKHDRDFARLTADIRLMQAGSRITPAEVQAVAQDLARCNQSGGTALPGFTGGNTGLDVLIFTTYAVLGGVDNGPGWAATEAELAGDYAALGEPVAPSLMAPGR